MVSTTLVESEEICPREYINCSRYPSVEEGRVGQRRWFVVLGLSLGSRGMNEVQSLA